MSGVRFESVEDRLRVTFEEMIPRLVEHVATVQVVETAPPVGRATTPSPVWTPNSVIGPPRRRWAVMGAVAVAASVAALAFVISRDDHAPGSAIGGDGTVAIGAELPEWYALLRAGVPPRFQYLALAYATPHDAFFVAFDPTDGKLLDIAAATAPGATSPQITCNVGPRPEDTLEPLAADWDTAACSSAAPDGTTPFGEQDATATEAALDGPALVAAAQSAPQMRLGGGDIMPMLDAAWPDAEAMAQRGVYADIEFEYGAPATGETVGMMRALAAVYPRPAERVEGPVVEYPRAGGAVATFWVIDPSGVAVRITTVGAPPESAARMRQLADALADQLIAVPYETVDVPPPTDTAGLGSTDSTATDPVSLGTVQLPDGSSVGVAFTADGNGVCLTTGDGVIGGCDGRPPDDNGYVVFMAGWGAHDEQVIVYGYIDDGLTISLFNGEGTTEHPLTISTGPAVDGRRAFAGLMQRHEFTALVIRDASGQFVSEEAFGDY